MRVQELFDLSGRTALVTGGGRGIGRYIALGLAEAGADVVVASRKLANCEEVAKAIEALGRRAWAVPADLSRPEEIDALAERTLAAVGRLDVLVNNAGVTWGAPVLEYPMSAWDKVYQVNVRGLWQLSQRIALHMRDAGGGAMIHVTSIGGFRGAPDAVQPAIAYNSSKGAVITLTKDMAIKLAPFGIRVNALAPGPFLIDMFNHVRRDPARVKALEAGVPLRRTGEEDDIKGAAVFLASRAAAYVTGHVLAVDGGILAG